MNSERNRVSSGVTHLDSLLGELLIGDNVVLYDDVGSLASVFCLKFIQASQEQNRPVIYVCFDHSPKNLLEKLGKLAENPLLHILDCFTHGKGGGSELFLKFYDKNESGWPCQIIRVDNPNNAEKVTELFYKVHSTLEGDVRFVFESLTGMQELWNKEEHILRLYSQSCPRLYELNTIAYWIIEKHAHSGHLRAHINKIAQVAIDLSLKRGRTSLTILKAEKRNLEILNKPHTYRSKDLNITFDSETRPGTGTDLGGRLKNIRGKCGLSQTELAKLVGVTPSNISQVESNLIYPSLPTLMKMAEILSTDITSFFQSAEDAARKLIFKASEGTDVKISDSPKKSVSVKRFAPADFEGKAEPFLIEIMPGKKLNSHFFSHKGEEMGYLISGKLQMKIDNASCSVNSGEMIYLTSETPSQWKNTGSVTAKLLWIKIR